MSLAQAQQEFESAQMADPQESQQRFLVVLEQLQHDSSPQARRLQAQVHIELARHSDSAGRLEHQGAARELFQQLVDEGACELTLPLANLEANLGLDLLESRKQPVIRTTMAKLLQGMRSGTAMMPDQAPLADPEALLLSAIRRFEVAQGASGQATVARAELVHTEPAPQADQLAPVHTAPSQLTAHELTGYGKALYHLAMFYQSERNDRRAAELYFKAEQVFHRLPESVETLPLCAASAQNLCVALDQCYQHQDSVNAGERAVILYQKLVAQGHWRYYGSLAQTLVNVVMSAYYLQDNDKIQARAPLALALLHDLAHNWRQPQFQHLLQSLTHNLGVIGYHHHEAEGVTSPPTGLHHDGSCDGTSALGVSPETQLAQYALAQERFDLLLSQGRLDLVEPRARSLLDQARFHQSLGQHALAVDILQSALDHFQAINRAGRADLAWEIVDSQALLGHSHLQLGQTNQAFPLLQSCRELLQALAGVDAQMAERKTQEFRGFLQEPG